MWIILCKLFSIHCKPYYLSVFFNCLVFEWMVIYLACVVVACFRVYTCMLASDITSIRVITTPPINATQPQEKFWYIVNLSLFLITFCLLSVDLSTFNTNFSKTTELGTNYIFAKGVQVAKMMGHALFPG